jgi:hypothetical protein
MEGESDIKRDKKKKQKKDKQVVKEDVAASPAVLEKLEEIVDVPKEKKSKKRKAEVVLEEEHVEIGVEEKKEKKSKKDKKEKKDRVTTTDRTQTTSNCISLYKEHPSTTAMTSDDISSLHEQWSVQVLPEEEIGNMKPITQFEYIRPSVGSMCPYIMRYIEEKGFPKPTAIQVQLSLHWVASFLTSLPFAYSRNVGLHYYKAEI